MHVRGVHGPTGGGCAVNWSHWWALLLGFGWAMLAAWWITGRSAPVLALLGALALVGVGALHLRAWRSRQL